VSDSSLYWFILNLSKTLISKQLVAHRSSISRTIYNLTIYLCKRTGYFWHGRLDWNYHSLAGKYVREICKPLYVSIQSSMTAFSFSRMIY